MIEKDLKKSGSAGWGLAPHCAPRPKGCVGLLLIRLLGHYLFSVSRECEKKSSGGSGGKRRIIFSNSFFALSLLGALEL